MHVAAAGVIEVIPGALSRLLLAGALSVPSCTSRPVTLVPPDTSLSGMPMPMCPVHLFLSVYPSVCAAPLFMSTRVASAGCAGSFCARRSFTPRKLVAARSLIRKVLVAR